MCLRRSIDFAARFDGVYTFFETQIDYLLQSPIITTLIVMFIIMLYKIDSVW